MDLIHAIECGCLGFLVLVVFALLLEVREIARLAAARTPTALPPPTAVSRERDRVAEGVLLTELCKQGVALAEKASHLQVQHKHPKLTGAQKKANATDYVHRQALALGVAFDEEAVHRMIEAVLAA